MNKSSLFFIIILIGSFAFMMNPDKPFAQMPELENQQQNQKPTITVCGMADTLMTFQNPAKVVKDYMCHSA